MAMVRTIESTFEEPEIKVPIGTVNRVKCAVRLLYVTEKSMRTSLKMVDYAKKMTFKKFMKKPKALDMTENISKRLQKNKERYTIKHHELKDEKDKVDEYAIVKSTRENKYEKIATIAGILSGISAAIFLTAAAFFRGIITYEYWAAEKSKICKAVGWFEKFWKEQTEKVEGLVEEAKACNDDDFVKLNRMTASSIVNNWKEVGNQLQLLYNSEVSETIYNGVKSNF
ncbi:13580_t:CDS:2, partial [Gigaspora margarita]